MELKCEQVVQNGIIKKGAEDETGQDKELRTLRTSLAKVNALKTQRTSIGNQIELKMLKKMLD